MTTQPAGEHHTGTLSLTGEGNAPQDTLTALDDEIARTYGAIHAPDNLAEILTRHGWARASETRQQVAEEIAVALEAEALRHTVPTAALTLDGVAATIAREIGRGA